MFDISNFCSICFRYLMKSWASALNNEHLTPSVAYLNYEIKYGQTAHWDSSLAGIVAAFQTVAANKIKIAYNHIENRKKQGFTHEEASNHASIELASAAEAHCRAYLMQINYEISTKEVTGLSLALKEVILQLCDLYAVDGCFRAMGDLLRVRNTCTHI